MRAPLNERRDSLETTMARITVSPILRWALRLDALASGATGLLLLLAPGALEQLLRIPADLLTNAGLILVPYAALVAFLGTRTTLSSVAVWMVIGINLLWALDSFVFLAGDWAQPSALGIVFVTGQALVVAGFAVLQLMGLKRSALAA